jgi:hypothetical protein
MRKRMLKQLTVKQEMDLFAEALNVPSSFLAQLQASPRWGKQLGHSAERCRRRFAAAYPGKTRTRRILNADWNKAGHHHIAALNRAMGLNHC